MPLRIGILNSDAVRPELEAIYGDYPFMFTELLKSADPTIDITVYDVMNGEYPADIHEVDAYLVTGSKFSVYDDEEWIRQLGAFIVKLNEHEKKLVAICFGHQLVAHFLGGKTEKSSKGWSVGAQQCTVSENLLNIISKNETICFLASHQDQVVKVANNARTIASSDLCPHVMTKIGNHTLTLQWHPEFIKGYVEQLLHIRKEILGETLYQQAISSLKKSLDNHRFAQLAIDFINN